LEQSRVDITHYEKIDDKKIEEIELLANEVVLKNIPIEKVWMDRGEAEKRYGFRLYQGGVPVGKKIRVVRIGDFDVEACAGTHTKGTNDVGMIKILKTERIQDGVERITFAAGMASVKHVQKHHALLRESSDVLRVFPEQLPKTVKRFFDEWKGQKKQIEKLRKYGAQSPLEELKESAEHVGDASIMHHIAKDADKDTFEELIAVGRKVYDMDKTVAVLGCDFEGGKIIVARSKYLELDCRPHAKEAGKFLGGGGGGKPEFAQAGGDQPENLEKAVKDIKNKIKKMLK
jgi:alanyl-tRNA synthetase